MCKELDLELKAGIPSRFPERQISDLPSIEPETPAAVHGFYISWGSEEVLQDLFSAWTYNSQSSGTEPQIRPIKVHKPGCRVMAGIHKRWSCQIRAKTFGLPIADSESLLD